MIKCCKFEPISPVISLFRLFFCFSASFPLFGGKIWSKPFCLFVVKMSMKVTRSRFWCAVRFRQVAFVCCFSFDTDKLEKLNSARSACRKPIKGEAGKMA